MSSSPSRSTRYAQVFVLAFVAFQIAMPLSYYLGEQREDERFAWRMFSVVRMTPCRGAAFEVDQQGKRQAINLTGAVHVAWIALLQRNRHRVVERFMARRCDQEPTPREVRYQNVCQESQLVTATHDFWRVCKTSETGYEVRR